MIITKNLQKRFGDHEVLKGIDQHIEKGEKVVIIGPSGSGKSTFLRCLNLLEEPTGGEVWFEDTNITDPKVDINKLRQEDGDGISAVQPVSAQDGDGKHHAGPDQAFGKIKRGGGTKGERAAQAHRS